MISDLVLNDVPGSALGVTLIKPPPIVSAPEAGDWMEAGGLDGQLWDGTHALAGVEAELTIYVAPGADIDAVMAWLRGATTLRWTPHRFFYRVKAAAVLPMLEDWEEFTGEGWTAELTYMLDPYRYLWPEGSADRVTLTAAGTVVNRGRDASEPVIALTGSGDISLFVGPVTVQIEGLDGSIVLDCAARQAYDPATKELMTGSVTLLGGYGDGGRRWPRLSPGGNSVSWTGTVTGVTVDVRPRSR